MAIARPRDTGMGEKTADASFLGNLMGILSLVVHENGATAGPISSRHRPGSASANGYPFTLSLREA